MNWDLTCRSASVIITSLLVVLVTNYDHWVSLVIGFGFAHYLLSFYYARAGIRAAVTQLPMLVPLASLCALLVVVYFLGFPLEIYFGIHHACNEGYLRRNNSQGQGSDPEQLKAARTLLHLAAYLCILRFDPMVSQLPAAFLWSFLVIAAVIYLVAFLAARAVAPPGRAGLLGESGVELVALLMVGVSFLTQITFLQVVMYHFVLWTIAPIPAIRERGMNQLAEYVLLTAGSLLFFIALIMSQLFSSYLSLSFFYSQFIIWSYIHITTSFALSSSHPQWIVNLFRPQVQKHHWSNE